MKDEVQPDSLELRAEEAARKRRVLVPLLVGGVILAVALVMAVAGLSYSRDHDRARNRAYSGVAYCFLGGEPSANEKPSMRVRAMQRGLLAARASAKEGADEGANDWPLRCHKPVADLLAALKEYGEIKEGNHDLGYWARTLQEKQPLNRAEYGQVLDSFFEEAQKNSFKYEAPTDAQAPPQPLEAWTAGDLTKKSLLTPATGFARFSTDEVPGGILRLMWSEEIGARFCTTTDGAEVTCTRMQPRGALRSLRNASIYATADDDGPTMLAEPSDAYLEDGTKLSGKEGFRGGYVRKDKVAYEVLREGDNKTDALRLRRYPASGAPTEAKVVLEKRSHFEIFRDWLVFQDEEQNLAAKQVLLDGKEPALGPLVKIGRALSTNTSLKACQMKDGLAVVESEGASQQIAFLRGSTWSPPVRADNVDAGFFCGDDHVILFGSKILARCEPGAASCKAEEHVSLSWRDSQRASFAVVDGRTLTWARVHGGQDLPRLEVRSGDKLVGEALFDPFIKAGQLVEQSQIHELRLFSRRSFALVLVASADGIHALRIGKDGKLVPLVVTEKS